MKQGNKGLVLPVILISCILAIIVLLTTSAEEVSISIDTLTADPGGICTAPVMLKSITDYGAGSITLRYDPAVVQVANVTGSEDSAVMAWNADNTIGEVRIAAWNISGINGDIDFAVITFRAANISSSTPLLIQVDELITMDRDGLQNTIEASVINGEFTIRADSGVQDSK